MQAAVNRNCVFRSLEGHKVNYNLIVALSRVGLVMVI